MDEDPIPTPANLSLLDRDLYQIAGGDGQPRHGLALLLVAFGHTSKLL